MPSCPLPRFLPHLQIHPPRLYLFENSSTGLKLLADYWISVGKSGIEITVEGDLRAGRVLCDQQSESQVANPDLERIIRTVRVRTPDFTNNGKTLAQWAPVVQTELKKRDGRNLELKDVSYLGWTDMNNTMVVTFGVLTQGAKTGQTKRQYWTRQSSQ